MTNVLVLGKRGMARNPYKEEYYVFSSTYADY
jgi:hypothetical protein